MTSKCPVRPYKSITSRTERRPSLQRVCTWKSQSRKGSYPGTLHPHVEMLAVGGAVPQDLGPEIPHVKRKHLALPHRVIPPGRRPHPAAGAHPHASDFGESPPKIRVFAVKLDRAIEAPDALECVRTHGEVAAVENRAE